jgi:hypothetical protein
VPTDWFRLNPNDGGLTPAEMPARAKPQKWIERDLEHLLAMNPSFLDVVDELPIRVNGGTTSTLPDQAYVDSLGRLTVVELKAVSAGLGAVAQVIAYADHWRGLPRGEVKDGLSARTTANGLFVSRGRSLDHVRRWASGDQGSIHGESELASLGHAVSNRLDAANQELGARDLAEYASRRWGCDALPLVGAPARLVVAAPAFQQPCIEFAGHLSQRMVAIELLRVEIAKAGRHVYVGREWVHRDVQSEPTWRILRRVWQHREIREDFDVNGWADALNRESFSLSLRPAPDARFWFVASGTEAWIYTTVPDGWYGRGSRRDELRARYLDALPNSRTSDGRWLEWTFSLPGETAKMVACILTIARAVRDVLGPVSKDARSSQI